MLYLLAKVLLSPFFLLLMRPRVRGLRHLWRRGGAIVVSNHWALSDPILIALISPRVVHFMAKQELFQNPAARFVLMRGLYAFPVNRKHADMASLKQAMAVLQKGKVFGIFPEGRRSVTGELDELERGAAFLALRCNVPILPVYSDPRTYRKLRVNMIVGEPMDAAAIAAAHKGRSVDVVTQAIADKLQQLRLQLEA
ncbi:MAG TPA: 1-acyl-sn-glycerol-3-phosphate acyltransferase [Candidatus Aphodomorpha intestinavium]|uniref:1-acyl-sn-glycerol-3-phosphate acyltransferase n=1 Tax=Candidatus Aphodomorpha intestinavium TaxID=2840672 RepID=A0A9D1N4S3_9FIRM|nr:1-acyl-sn-glycerol-3-phosphate acyltransferase [Candidatus Aphodomorpha intestinavium]